MANFGWIILEAIIVIVAIGMYGYSLVEKVNEVDE
jgi:hypothetical protein